MRSDSREHEREDRWAGRAAGTRRAAPPSASPGCSATRHPAAVFFAALLSGVRRPRRRVARRRLRRDRVLLDDVGGLGARRQRRDPPARHRAQRRSSTPSRWSGRPSAARPCCRSSSGSSRSSARSASAGGSPRSPCSCSSIESATYRVTALVAPAPAPAVPRLEDLPANASYPSGHTAASIAVYAGLVFLLVSGVGSRGVRIAAWAVAIVVPIFVAIVADVPRHAPPARRRGRRSSSASAR